VNNNDSILRAIRESYDSLADEYARRIFNELQHKPLDSKLLDRFSADTSAHGEGCDIGCGPGHIARYLRDAGATVFGLENELWGRHISMDFFLFETVAIRQLQEAAGFAIEEIIEREPNSSEVEYQSRRAYIFARKPACSSPH
jgi:SAM-dependent methyltransferase